MTRRSAHYRDRIDDSDAPAAVLVPPAGSASASGTASASLSATGSGTASGTGTGSGTASGTATVGHWQWHGQCHWQCQPQAEWHGQPQLSGTASGRRQPQAELQRQSVAHAGCARARVLPVAVPLALQCARRPATGTGSATGNSHWQIQVKGSSRSFDGTIAWAHAVPVDHGVRGTFKFKFKFL